MYTVKSCTEFNILTGIPPCSEYLPRGLRGLPVADECNSDPETWWSRVLNCTVPGTTKSHVLNRIRLEPAGRAPLRSPYNPNIP